MGWLPIFRNRNNFGNKNDVQGNSDRGLLIGEEPHHHPGLLDYTKAVGKLATEKRCRSFPLEIKN